ncbi:MAG: ComEC/Rec2 family competence protein [Lachnospiraceae bacterium]|nr:ComEC/Rec2 family competence protein [Lachnospiraceae bacterium]
MTKRKNHRKSNPRKRYKKPRSSRRMRRLTLPLLLLLCLMTYFFPEQTGNILEKLENNISNNPVAEQLSSLLGAKKEQNTIGSGNFEVHFLDVGQGLSVLIRSDSHAMLYDGGGRESSSFVVSYLQSQGIRTLDYIVASHYDADHISGLIGALHAFNVDRILGPDYVHDSATYASFMNTAAEKGLSVEHPTPGDMFTLGDAGFTVLAPDRIYEDPNNNSIVIRLVNGQNSFLLMGDAESESEESMCRSNLKVQCDVLCPSHHGSSDGTSSLLLDSARPKYAVISCGAGNDYGHPHRETLQRLADAGVTVYRTDELGTVIAYSDGNELWWEGRPSPFNSSE